MRIAVVNDTPMAVEAQRRTVQAGGHALAWVAADGAEALRRCAADRPDVILMDLLMPVMDGVAATRAIMAQSPCAILLVTADPKRRVGMVFEAMGAGALDVVAAPDGLTLSNPAASPLLVKLATIAQLIGASGKGRGRGPETVPAPARTNKRGKSLIAIGSSAGGPAALAAILGKLPKTFAVPIIVVQHVDETFASGLASWLDGQTSLSVRIAQAGDQPEAGSVLVAGRNDHLIFATADTLAYTPHPDDYPYRPSVDVFFESVTRWWRGGVLGVLLTGMGRDGGSGLKALRNKGFRTIAQDQATSAIYGMPKHAASIGAATDILPLERIGCELENFARAEAA